MATLQKSSGKQKFEEKQLTTGTLSIYNPSFSPDTRRIAFSMGNNLKSNLYVMNVADGSIHQITFMNSFNDSPAWSPKGDRIAFASKGSKTSRVWSVRSDAEELHEFIHTEVSNDAPRQVVWAPSNQILYESVNNRNFYLLNPETEKQKKLIDNESVGWVFIPRFSSDGHKLAV
jgi:Tol biopolymer transport system component